MLHVHHTRGCGLNVDSQGWDSPERGTRKAEIHCHYPKYTCKSRNTPRKWRNTPQNFSNELAMDRKW